MHHNAFIDIITWSSRHSHIDHPISVNVQFSQVRRSHPRASEWKEHRALYKCKETRRHTMGGLPCILCVLFAELYPICSERITNVW